MKARLRKAVVLAGGRGTRMQRPDARARLDAGQEAAADAGAKGMMPIRGRPFLDYVFSSLADAGLSDVCVVTPPGGGGIPEHYAAAPPRRVRLVFAEQPRPFGSGDALLAAEAFAGNEDFVSVNSDNLYPPGAFRALQALDGCGLPVFERDRLVASSNFTPERVAAFAVLRVSPDGWLEDIVEKPGEGAVEAAGSGGPVLLSLNLWRFAPSIFEACRSVPLSRRGERELPQAVGWAIARLGERFRAVPCGEGVLDLSTRADVAEVERRLDGIEARP